MEMREAMQEKVSGEPLRDQRGILDIGHKLSFNITYILHPTGRPEDNESKDARKSE